MKKAFQKGSRKSESDESVYENPSNFGFTKNCQIPTFGFEFELRHIPNWQALNLIDHNVRHIIHNLLTLPGLKNFLHSWNIAWISLMQSSELLYLQDSNFCRIILRSKGLLTVCLNFCKFIHHSQDNSNWHSTHITLLRRISRALSTPLHIQSCANNLVSHSVRNMPLYSRS